MESLTEKVLQYQRTREGLRDIIDTLAPRVYQFPRATMGWDEDACGDFYVFIHPRLLRLLDRFHDQGKPFEVYLWAVLGWQLRNFARDRRRREVGWKVSLRMTRDDASVPVQPDADEDDGLPAMLDIARHIETRADRRNFLFLSLKCARLIDPQSAQPLAAIAGITPEALLSIAASLKDLRACRETRLATFRHRRNRAFASIELIETELVTEIDQERRERLQTDLAKARRRMRLASDRMAKVGVAPTNREIARVLGVPKGTVDSGLYWLKRKLSSVYDPENLRSA
jgi:DNA-directed RNA polymerase specialized sigma24 family protein